MTPDRLEVMVHSALILPTVLATFKVVGELTDLRALILLILLDAPEGGLDAEQITAEVRRVASFLRGGIQDAFTAHEK